MSKNIENNPNIKYIIELLCLLFESGIDGTLQVIRSVFIAIFAEITDFWQLSEVSNFFGIQRLLNPFLTSIKSKLKLILNLFSNHLFTYRYFSTDIIQIRIVCHRLSRSTTNCFNDEIVFNKNIK